MMRSFCKFILNIFADSSLKNGDFMVKTHGIVCWFLHVLMQMATNISCNVATHSMHVTRWSSYVPVIGVELVCHLFNCERKVRKEHSKWLSNKDYVGFYLVLPHHIITNHDLDIRRLLRKGIYVYIYIYIYSYIYITYAIQHKSHAKRKFMYKMRCTTGSLCRCVQQNCLQCVKISCQQTLKQNGIKSHEC